MERETLAVRAFHYGRGPKIHAAKNIVYGHGNEGEEIAHVRMWCGLSGSPASRQFNVAETSDPVNCRSCIGAMGLRPVPAVSDGAAPAAAEEE